MTSHSSLWEGQESGARGRVDAQLDGLGGSQGLLGKGQGWGLTSTVRFGLAALGPPLLADAELAVGLDVLPRSVAGAIHQAGALLGPHTLPLAAQHLPCRAPTAQEGPG